MKSLVATVRRFVVLDWKESADVNSEGFSTFDTYWWWTRSSCWHEMSFCTLNSARWQQWLKQIQQSPISLVEISQHIHDPQNTSVLTESCQWLVSEIMSLNLGNKTERTNTSTQHLHFGCVEIRTKIHVLMFEGAQSSLTSPALIVDHRSSPVLVLIPTRKLQYPVLQPKRSSGAMTVKLQK